MKKCNRIHIEDPEWRADLIAAAAQAIQHVWTDLPEGTDADTLARHVVAAQEAVESGYAAAAQRCAPSKEEVREAIFRSTYPKLRWIDLSDENQADFDAAAEAILSIFAAQPTVREAKAEGWDEGHQHRWRRGPDECICAAWSRIECACGKYGTGELLSLADNPYRSEADHGDN